MRIERTEPKVIVFARLPQLGVGKTRLASFLSPQERFELSKALFFQTLKVVEASGLPWIVCLSDSDGQGISLPFPFVLQRGDGLSERMSHAFADIGCPAVMVGSDLLDLSVQKVQALVKGLDEADLTLLCAQDGGYGGIGLRTWAPVFEVPMSQPTTAQLTLDEAHQLGLRTKVVGTVRDVDRYEDYLLWKRFKK